MNKNFTIRNPMAPTWIMYPMLSRYSLGWRMGFGEYYSGEMYQWKKTLSQEDQKQYDQLFPHPKFWRGPGYDDSDMFDEEYRCCLVWFWNKDGLMSYDQNLFIEKQKAGEILDFVFFWKPGSEKINESCFSQWHMSSFNVDANEYCCTEQYMMAEKARVFEDDTTRIKILDTDDPGKIQKLGRQVKNFDAIIWNKVKYSIVLNGNYYKFSQNKKMRDHLFSTEEKILVEASPLDKIWGIGLDSDHPDAKNPNKWKGSNLLGFALMEVRDELKRLYKNYDRIDWEQLKKYDD